MNLASTISIYAGGAGSGCNPAVGKCGRPSSGKTKTAKQYGPVYHGTHKWTEEIKNNPKYRMGKFFSTNPLVAQAYGSFVHEATLTMKKPFIVDAKGDSYYSIAKPEAMREWFVGEKVDTDSIVRFAYEHGYDGVIVKNVDESHAPGEEGDDYIVFKPDQIKLKGIVEPEISPYTANKFHKQELQRRLDRKYNQPTG